ncbi:MAG: hypothetical protein R3B06_02615 [Kofleriaceae bacterium]
MIRRGLVLPVAVALVATAPRVHGDLIARTDIEQAMSGIDYQPDRAELEQLLAGNLATLVVLADNSGTAPGIRLRSYRALGRFDSDLARSALTAAIARFSDDPEPTNQLFLIAALEGLGDNGGAAAVPVLASQLNHALQDVRAAATRALAATNSAAACPYIGRNPDDPSPQVNAALDEAKIALTEKCLDP